MLASSRAALRARGMPHALGFAARDIGGGGIPDQWGQPKTGGTQFLGTPANYMQLLKTRPVSPDLFGVEGTLTERAASCVCSTARSGSHIVQHRDTRRGPLQVPPRRRVFHHQPGDGRRAQRRCARLAASLGGRDSPRP